MNAQTTIRLIEAMALNAEVQGMVAENEYRKHRRESPAFVASSFDHKASDLRSIANHLARQTLDGTAT